MRMTKEIVMQKLKKKIVDLENQIEESKIVKEEWKEELESLIKVMVDLEKANDVVVLYDETSNNVIY